MKRPLITLSAMFLLVAVLAIAAIWIQVTPQYQAKGEVRVRPVIPRLVFRTDENGEIPFYESFVNTQASLIQSTSILQRVLDQGEIQKTNWFKTPPRSLKDRLLGNPPSPPLERLRHSLCVKPRPQTEIIEVSMTGPSTEEAKLLVDAVLDQYMMYVREVSAHTEDDLYMTLKDQYESLKNTITGIETTCADIRRRLGSDDPQKLISSKRSDLDSAMSRVRELQRDISLLEWEREAIKNVAEKTPISDSNESVTSQAPLPLTVADNANRPHVSAAQSLEHQLKRAKKEKELLLADIHEQEAEYRKVFDIVELLEREQSSLARKRKLFEAVQDRVDQKTMERNVPHPIEMLSQAFAPSRPHRDRRVLYTVIVLILDGLAMVFAWWRVRRRCAL